MSPNKWRGATIESNIYPQRPNAPLWSERARAMRSLPTRFPKVVCIEPIMDFDFDGIVDMLRKICPALVYMGYDNHGKHLPEPPLAKTKELVAELGKFTEVRAKTLREPWWCHEGGHIDREPVPVLRR